MNDDIAQGILRAQSAYEAERCNFDSSWQRIADLIDPDNSLFLRQNLYQGERRDQYQFDSTGQLALGRFAAAMESVLTPRTQQWHALVPAEPSLLKNRKVMAFCEAKTRMLFAARYMPEAGFVQATGEAYKSLGAYGNQCLLVQDIPGRTISYQSQFIGWTWCGKDAWGRVDRVHRKFKLKARQALAMFPAEKLPKRIRDAKGDEDFEFLHCVKPRDDYDPERRDHKGKRFGSYYVAIGAENALVEEGGFRTMPYIYSMYSTAPGETYGRGPASQILPTLNTLNEQQKTALRAGQRVVDPPLLAAEEDLLGGFSLRAGAINFGSMSSMGQRLVEPLQTGANLAIGIDFIEQSRAVVNDAFFVTLFQILTENPRMTATEALLRAQEKGELLGPPMGRQQTGMLSPLIERELDILSEAVGFWDDAPEEIMESGGFMDIRYTAPLDRFQRAQEAAGIMQTFEQLTPWAQIDPTVMDVFNPRRVAQRLVEINGAPLDVTNDDDEMAQIQAAKDQQAQMASLLEAAPVAGKTALDLARAQQVSGAQPTAGLLAGR